MDQYHRHVTEKQRLVKIYALLVDTRKINYLNLVLAWRRDSTQKGGRKRGGRPSAHPLPSSSCSSAWRFRSPSVSAGVGELVIVSMPHSPSYPFPISSCRRAVSSAETSPVHPLHLPPCSAQHGGRSSITQAAVWQQKRRVCEARALLIFPLIRTSRARRTRSLLPSSKTTIPHPAHTPRAGKPRASRAWSSGSGASLRVSA